MRDGRVVLNAIGCRGRDYVAAAQSGSRVAEHVCGMIDEHWINSISHCAHAIAPARARQASTIS